MGPPSYMRSVVDRNVVMWRIPVLFDQIIFFWRQKKCKGKSVPLQAWSGPEGSRKLRFPDF